ncbi:hypothetical protein Patl1_13662 [Pistacia atlantica]|uniref:Uncharacterized protein n=1 Tax=Pistacia atlantica TaxID=434234 RepID=A0ACC1AU76_9ROSI|nr:hypothetical protein Patl1_13662 [Pistacia atlantica]
MLYTKDIQATRKILHFLQNNYRKCSNLVVTTGKEKNCRNVIFPHKCSRKTSITTIKINKPQQHSSKLCCCKEYLLTSALKLQPHTNLHSPNNVQYQISTSIQAHKKCRIWVLKLQQAPTSLPVNETLQKLHSAFKTFKQCKNQQFD